jgi:hypothetical protein
MNKKGPDKYKTVKCSLISIVQDEAIIEPFFDVMMRTHKMMIHSYQFLRLWVLHKYHFNNRVIPHITKETIRLVFKCLKLDSRGPKPDNTTLLGEFQQFYKDHYKSLQCDGKMDGCHLSSVLYYMATDMLTNIENNIKLHFIKYLNRFVNSSFKLQHRKIVDETPRGKKTIIRQKLQTQLARIKYDLLNNTLTCDEEYHEWLNQHRNHLLPTEYKDSYEFDIQQRPQKYLKHMIYMCLELEKLGTKSFQFFPLRTDIVPKYIPIDNRLLIDMFVENKKSAMDNVEAIKEELWETYFRIDDPIFEQKNYIFDYRISTDCVAVSIQLIHSSYVEPEKLKKANMKKARNTVISLYKGMTKQEKKAHQAKKEEKRLAEKEEQKLKAKKVKEQKKKEFKTLSKEKQAVIVKQMKVTQHQEFPYLEELTDKQVEHLSKNKWVVVDPGKRCLLYMMNEAGDTFQYTNKTHVFKTKRLKYQRMNQRYRDREGMTEVESELSAYSSKTCDVELFKDYIYNKNHINRELFDDYAHERFRQYRWYGYINKQRAQTDLIRDIKDTFGKDTILVMGDWSAKGQINFMSTPNLGLKRKLAKQLPVYSIDEFRTSCLSCVTQEKCTNLYLPDKKGVDRKKHSILTYQMENNRMGCINRDNNAVNNMVYLVQYFLKYKNRPENFKRSCKLPTKNKKSLQPTNVKCKTGPFGVQSVL